MNFQGEIVIPFEYDEIELTGEGLLKAKKGRTWGVLNSQGEIVIPFEYAEIELAGDGLLKAKKWGEWGVFNMQGKILPSSESVLSEGFLKGEMFGKWGAYTLDRCIVIPFEYSSIDIIGKGLFRVGKYDSCGWYNGYRKFGVFNIQGEIIIPFEYDEIDEFVDGMVRVRKNQSWICFDSNGFELGDTINMFFLHQKYEGIITNIVSFGIFVEIPHRKVGLLHVNELKKRGMGIDDFKVNDKITVLVKSIDEIKKQVSFRLPPKKKELSVKCGEKYVGKVVNILPYGLFVEIMNGQVGLLHKKEFIKAGIKMMDYKYGDSINVIVKSIDNNRIAFAADVVGG